MQNPTEQIVYHGASGDTYHPNEIQRRLRDASELSITLFDGLDPLIAVAEPRRFSASRPRAMVRHPSPQPSDAFIEVTFSASIQLPADRCQPVGATRPTGAISTAKREAMGLSDTDAPTDDPARGYQSGTVEWDSHVLTGSESATSADPVKEGSNPTPEDADTSDPSQTDVGEAADESPNSESRLTSPMSDGPPPSEARESSNDGSDTGQSTDDGAAEGETSE